jgi:hypothetical protein
MDISLALEILAVVLALLCVLLMPVAIRRDPGLGTAHRAHGRRTPSTLA